MFEDPKTIAAVIALVGVLVSITSSFFVARFAAKNERERIKQQLHNVYSERIVTERINSYPQLYDLVSSFLKTVYDGSFVEEGSIFQLKDSVRKWDGKHAMFMGSQTQHDMYLFRKALDSFCDSFDESNREYAMNDLEELWKSMTRLELSLKADVGVFILDEYDRKATFLDYGSLMDHMKVK